MPVPPLAIRWLVLAPLIALFEVALLVVSPLSRTAVAAKVDVEAVPWDAPRSHCSVVARAPSGGGGLDASDSAGEVPSARDTARIKRNQRRASAQENEVIAIGGVMVWLVCVVPSAVALRAAARAGRAQEQHPDRGFAHGHWQVTTLLIALAQVPFLFSASTASAAGATPARAFTDSVCVATHLHYSGTPYYRRWPEVRDALVNAGIRHVRDSQLDNTVWSYPTVSARWKEWADRGVRATLGPYPGDLARKVALAAQNPAVEAIEGPNELDQSGTGWQTRLLDAQRAIWNATRGQSNLVGRPVLVGALAFSNRWSQVTTDLTPYFTRGNLHSYPGGQTPSSNLSTQFAATAAAFGSAPVRVTETGYHNTVGAPSTEWHRPTSERASGIYVPQLYLEYFRRGIRRSCLYEFLDEWADPEKDNRESNFGLLRNDLTPKPAYRHLQRLMSLLADPFPTTTPARLDYTVSGPSTLRRLLFQKGDGSFWLALWNDVSVWDPVARADRYPAGAATTLSLGGSRAWSVYDVRGGTAPISSGTGFALNLNVPVIPLLVKIR